MPVEAKPLFRPEILDPKVNTFRLPNYVEEGKEALGKWAEMLASGRTNKFTEREILPDFLTEVFCQILDYSRPADSPQRYTFSREKHVEVDGKFAEGC